MNINNKIEYFYDVLYKWINVYCSGCMMSVDFRKEASKIFKEIRIKSSDFLSCSSLIYRIQKIDKYDEILRFDDLYYSFSEDLDGIAEVIRFDRNLYKDLILIIAKPLDHINLFELCCDVYESFNSRYIGENEILSKFSKDSIKSVYYLRSKDDIYKYKTDGVLVDLNDLNLKGKEFLKKYKNQTEY